MESSWHRKIDAYAGGTRTDVLIISRLNAAGRFYNIFYNIFYNESPEGVVRRQVYYHTNLYHIHNL